MVGTWLTRVGMAVALMALLPPTAFAQATPAVEVEIDGRDIADSDAHDPLMLEPDEEAEISVVVGNTGDEPLLVRSVRLQSRVVGLTFLAYETRVDLEVPPGEVGDRVFLLDLLDLENQASGLLPADVVLLDGDREPIETVPLAVDVRGSFLSVYGLFGLLVAVVTAVLLVRTLLLLSRGGLPENRWSRGIRFGAPGIGIALVVTVTVSVFRLFLPSPSIWLLLLIGFGGGFFLLGYLSPTPGRDEVEEDEELVDVGDAETRDTVQLDDPYATHPQAAAPPSPYQPDSEPAPDPAADADAVSGAGSDGDPTSTLPGRPEPPDESDR